MSAFLNPLLLRALSPDVLKASRLESQNYLLTGPFSYQSDLLGITITAPVGLLTDFASIPRIAWSILDPEDPMILYPSVIHDYLYKAGGVIPNLPPVTRQQADKVLREAMEHCGAGNWKRTIVYQSVERFGASNWGKPPATTS